MTLDDRVISNPEVRVSSRPTPLVQCEITTETVLTQDGGFEQHPEAMYPRVFFSVVQTDSRGEIFDVRHYELLQTGYVLQWPTLPEGKFDYMHFTVPNLSAMKFVHAEDESGQGTSRFDRD